MKNLFFIVALLLFVNVVAKDMYQGPKFKMKKHHVKPPKVHVVEEGHEHGFKLEDPQERDVASSPSEDKKKPSKPEVPYWKYKK
ncbi:MAG: hypothetical protein GY909_05640 [Oligoflexia bacterium]|nr:hypothetical protein [Oligoflexia bacterium]